MNDFTSVQLDKFLTLPHEELILAKREHSFILAISLVSTFLISIVSIILITLLLELIQPSSFVYLSVGLFIFVLTFTVMVKQVVDWHYHLYIISTRRIIEITASPFYSDVISDVFLDQVRTTEVDIKIKNFLYELIDIGDIIISFDRPSHDASFILKNISEPYGVGMLLGDQLEEMMRSTPVWFNRETTPSHIKFTEDAERQVVAQI